MRGRPLLGGTLTPDQIAGAEFLASRRVALLGDKAGFGKSAQFVLAAESLGAERVTILCPPVARVNAAEQWRLWSFWGLPVTIIRSGKDVVPSHGVVICSYKLAGENAAIQRALTKRRNDVLILDEAHYCKDPRAKRTKGVFAAGGIASTSARVWLITGTPTPNHAGEYYVLAKAAGLFRGTYNDFVKLFCTTAEVPDPKDASAFFRYALSVGTWREGYDAFIAAFYNLTNGTLTPKRLGAFKALERDKIIGSKNENELKALLAPAVLARNKVDPSRAPLEIDTLAIEGAMPRFEGVDRAAIEAITAAIESENWHALDGPAVATVRRQIGIAKAEPVADMIALELETDPGFKLAFFQHTAAIDTCAARLGDRCEIIDGRTSPKRRDEIISRFQRREGPPVLICQGQALKEAVTLTAATRVYLVEPPWTPDDCEQMIARAWRRGQSRAVRASYVYLHNSFDQRVAATLARKSSDLAKISLSVTL